MTSQTAASSSAKSRTVTIGFVGCAHCHTPWIAGILKHRADVVVKSVWDHDIARAEGVAQTLNARVVDAPASIWSDASIDGVFVCAETDRHEELVLDGAAARKPMFVEKPLGMGTADSSRMAAAMTKAGVIFGTGYRTRSEGLFLFLRERIRRGSFGKLTRIRYINCHGFLLQKTFDAQHGWHADPAQAGAGAFLDLGTHAVDAVLWLMGERVVSATSITGGGILNVDATCETFGEGLMKFESGAIGSVAAGWVDVDQPVRCVISGSEGHAYVLNNQLYFKSSNVPGADGKAPWTDLPADLPIVFELFVNALQGAPAEALVTPREAAEVCAVQDAMQIGARSGTWVAPRYSV